MNKNNVFKSSSFYMGEGDVLHMIVIDLGGKRLYVELSGGDDDNTEDNSDNTHIGSQIWAPLNVDDIITKRKYGLLYNHYAVVNVKNIAPAGWHVPTYAEWDALCVQLGGNSLGHDEVAGGMMKVTGTTYWDDPNTGATNSSGFNATGNGYRNDSNGYFSFLKAYSFWAVADDATICTYCSKWSAEFNMTTPFTNKTGLALRLIKDDSTSVATMTGNDGRVYDCVTIGTQVWMAENSCEIKYRDGTSIPEVTDAATWIGLVTGAMCVYNNDWSNAYSGSRAYNDNEANVATYGRLYTPDLVADINALHPGWHVPTTTDWTTLKTYLGGGAVAASALKETGTTHWLAPNIATNSYSFFALPGGLYSTFAGFSALQHDAHFLTSDGNEEAMIHDSAAITEYAVQNGWYYSVRLIRD